MKILLFGKNGQVGWELQRSLGPLGTVIAPDRYSTDYCGDLSNADGLRVTVREVQPDVIVNAAAYTAVDKAEGEADLAHRINAAAPGVMALEAGRIDALMVHYSTDYVFDGSGSAAWNETAATGPVNVYGATKRAGEEAVLEAGCRALIFRTSWVYSACGSNFLKTMLRLARERERLEVIDDQFGAPTGADLIADVTAHAVRSTWPRHREGGLYHLAATGVTNWHGYARYAIDLARRAGVPLKVGESSIEAVASDAFPTVAKRPRNSRLDTSRLQVGFGLELPHWQDGVRRTVAEILGGER